MTGQHRPDLAGEQSAPPAPAPVLGQMIRGAMVTQLLYVAARLGIADLLRDGSKPSAALAASSGAHPRALYRVLRALAHLGLLAESADRHFALTPLGELLRADASGSLRGSALMYGEPWVWQPFGDLLHSVTTGTTAFNHAHGMPLFDYLSRNADAAAVFDQHMKSVTGQDAAAVVSAYDFSGLSTLVDVGGGHGALTAAILNAHPGLRGTLFDLGSVVERARAFVQSAGVAERCRLVAGDFFESVPSGADAYTLKDILHDWDDERAVAILRSCRRAMTGRARLLVIERVIPPGTEPAVGKLVDIAMLILTGGQERTAAEYGTLLQAARLELTSIVPTASPMSVIEAAPA